MIKGTLGRILVNQALPEQYRDDPRLFSGKGYDDVLADLARSHPEEYRKVSSRLMELGRHASYYEGTTLGLSDLRSPLADRQELFDEVRKREKEINDSDGTDKEKAEVRNQVYADMQQLITDNTYDNAVKTRNPLGLQVMSKARGNPTQLSAMISSPGAFKNAKGETIPTFITRSYSEGLRPHELYAATFGTRQGVISTKFATRDAGDFGKQLNVASADLVVTQDDCGTLGGIPVDVEDPDNLGAVLARDSGGYKMGTPINKTVLDTLNRKGFKKLLVRSPVTCNADGGICKLCAGQREDGEFPDLRDHIGMQAASALAERVAQGALNVKHSGGQKGKQETYAGFPIIEQLASVPESFKHKASVAELDGQVQDIQPAPQGGTFITIADTQHYVGPEQAVQVKVGDTMEAGDQMSSGIVNPADVVRHKGVGEGRRYFAERLTKAFRDSKLGVNRRNAEVVARAAINHVEVDEPEGLGGYMPGEVAQYSSFAHGYVPRPGSTTLNPGKAVGQYLEQPALHYTIGSRVTPNMVKQMKEFGVDKVTANEQEPGFSPTMVRLRINPHHGRDWMGRLQGSYLMDVVTEAAQKGEQSNIHGLNPVPGLAYGVEFGQSKPGKVTY
jgi:DNA-directed RNA polymerase subunit beta'